MEATPILLDIRHTSPPDGILFDTSFFFSAIIPQEQYHNEAKRFLQEIIDNGTVVVYSSKAIFKSFSPLTEVANKQLFRKSAGQNPRY